MSRNNPETIDRGRYRVSIWRANGQLTVTICEHGDEPGSLARTGEYVYDDNDHGRGLAIAQIEDSCPIGPGEGR